VAKEQKIKNEPGTKKIPPSQIKWHDIILIRIVDLANTIHTDHIGAFSFTLQCGNRYTLIAIHINANYLF
jgi:hypothetical protein